MKADPYQIIFLGVSSAVPTQDHDHVSLAVQTPMRIVLVDSGGATLPRMLQTGLDWRRLTDLILTHFHADHVSGVPNLLTAMWLYGRTQPLAVHGLPHTLERLQTLLEVFDWHTWEGLFPISFHPIPAEDHYLFIQYPELTVSASPTVHSKPSIAVRFDNLVNQTAAVYSADTLPCPQVAQLAKDAEILIHEATGPYNGHSTPAQTGAIAQEANAKHLYLVHLSPASQADRGEIVAQVRQYYTGGVTIAQEFMRVAF